MEWEKTYLDSTACRLLLFIHPEEHCQALEHPDLGLDLGLCFMMQPSKDKPKQQRKQLARYYNCLVLVQMSPSW